jgi:hypothetical protein
VVVPPGATIFVSSFMEDFSVLEHPLMPIETKLKNKAAVMTRFISKTFPRDVTIRWLCFDKKQALNRSRLL